MSTRARIAMLALLLAAALGGLIYRNATQVRPNGQVGMTERPCPSYTFAQHCFYYDDNARIAGAGPRPHIVLIGDSYTEFWKRHDPDMFSDRVVNRGIGGQTSQQVLLRFRQDVVNLKPAAVHVLVGTNDIAGNAGPSSPAMYMDNLETMADISAANRIALIVGTLPPARDFYWKPGLRPEPWVAELNDLIRRFAAERKVTLADYNAVLSAPGGGIREELYEDGAHLNDAGYSIMRKTFDGALRKVQTRENP